MGMQEFRVPQIRCSMHLVYLVPFVAKESQSEPLTFYLCVFPKFGEYGKVLQLK